MIYRYNQPKPVGPFSDYHCPVSGCRTKAHQVTEPPRCPEHRDRRLVQDFPIQGLRAMDAEDMHKRIDAFEALFKAKTSRWWRRG